ncbi:hypothetical protein L465_00407 [Enterobacter sp. BIDMC 29]|uniref:hypothetical protein n=1 Tax=Enterobacter sp. BIDMC 29 TaxID=1329841 RepID=UPI0004532734|nr:hypothetical protein [Enterobacter sp. BIDMC 29]EUM16593.1 hypothetical protein L465_00407 [Enterobacter sp. BIDMC 29]
MTPETEARVKAFRKALEQTADEPVLSTWRGYLQAFPKGCCELASQTLAEYLMEDDSNLHLQQELTQGALTGS